MIKPSPSTTRPIHSRVDRNRPKPVNTFARVLCEMLYRATLIDVLDDGTKKYLFNLGDTLAIVTARITSDFDEPPMYEIESVHFRCACNREYPDCPTEYFDNITYT